MGTSYSWLRSATPAEKRANTIEINRREKGQANALRAAREAVARKIVMVVIDKINLEIIRPGPVAEERECYEMSQELRDFSPALVEQVVAVFNTEGGVR